MTFLLVDMDAFFAAVEQRDLIVQGHGTIARPRRGPAGSVQVDG